MSDLTVYAEALIATVARAFYDDEAIILIDVLIRDKFLRDDDMAPRLSLPAKKLRATLQFLQEEHLVYSETVDDLAQGGSQATKFYYLDYNRAVHSIRLRVHLLKKQLESAELKARSSSFYLCPGYKQKRCNGRYTEEEAQQVLDYTTGLFLCRECSKIYENDPNAPSTATYTLQLVDNTKDLREAMDNLRRVNVQLSSKFIGNDQLRAGIFDLLQKVRQKNKTVTSNLPSENFSLGIGSKRLAGTGRTAGIKAKKLEQIGVAHNAAQARSYLVCGGDYNQSDETDLMFLKNAMGQEVQFTVERGGGARAQLLATRKRRRRKLMDAAASRVGASLPMYIRLEEEAARKRKAKLDAEKEEANNSGKKNKSAKNKMIVAGDTLEFLRDNIGRMNNAGEVTYADDTPDEANGPNENGGGGENANGDEEMTPDEVVLADDIEDLRQFTEETRRAAFQQQYKIEMDRQAQFFKQLLEQTPTAAQAAALNSLKDDSSAVDYDNLSITWEDGDKQ